MSVVSPPSSTSTPLIHKTHTNSEDQSMLLPRIGKIAAALFVFAGLASAVDSGNSNGIAKRTKPVTVVEISDIGFSPRRNVGGDLFKRWSATCSQYIHVHYSPSPPILSILSPPNLLGSFIVANPQPPCPSSCETNGIVAKCCDSGWTCSRDVFGNWECNSDYLGLSPGAKVGIAVGVSIFVLILIILGVVLCCYCCRKTALAEERNKNANNGYGGYQNQPFVYGAPPPPGIPQPVFLTSPPPMPTDGKDHYGPSEYHLL